MSGKRFVLYLLPIALAAALAGYMVSRELARTPALQLSSGTALPGPRALKPFALVDETGAPFGNAQLTGQPSLVFFGFTHCPDVCPTTLSVMAQLHRQPALSGIRIVFVTVDPKRDDPATLKQYVEAFGGDIKGLTGSEEALAPLLSSLGVVHAIQKLSGDDYTVDHSANLFYLDGHGEFVAVFTPPFSIDGLRADLAALLARAR
jgi:protein SCO1/2